MGSIHWNGSDLKSMPIETLREKMAVVFHDFARFPATVQENIGWANLAHLEDPVMTNTLLQKMRLFDFFTEQDGLNILLTKRFDRGTDLSGG
jgi:ABC-type transport system involved in cytochrome bd biosynthesis fused ATPase/permease subunit